MSNTQQQKEILFVCIENSSRSQMAEGYAKSKGMKASSAGTFPAAQINPLVIQAMDEIGVDISGGKPKLLTPDMIDKANLVILTDASLLDNLPKNLLKKIGKKLIVWSIPDPQGQPIEVVRFSRDRIQKDVDSLLKKEMA